MKQSRKAINPKANKALLVINILLFFTAIVLAILNLKVKEYSFAAGMLLVLLLAGINAYGCWNRLRSR